MKSFDSVMGVKQGCSLSPGLFGIYVDDLELDLEHYQDVYDTKLNKLRFMQFVTNGYQWM